MTTLDQHLENALRVIEDEPLEALQSNLKPDTLMDLGNCLTSRMIDLCDEGKLDVALSARMFNAHAKIWRALVTADSDEAQVAELIALHRSKIEEGLRKSLN